jgi:hypothetical protein
MAVTWTVQTHAVVLMCPLENSGVTMVVIVGSGDG